MVRQGWGDHLGGASREPRELGKPRFAGICRGEPREVAITKRKAGVLARWGLYIYIYIYEPIRMIKVEKLHGFSGQPAQWVFNY